MCSPSRSFRSLKQQTKIEVIAHSKTAMHLDDGNAHKGRQMLRSGAAAGTQVGAAVRTRW